MVLILTVILVLAMALYPKLFGLGCLIFAAGLTAALIASKTRNLGP